MIGSTFINHIGEYTRALLLRVRVLYFYITFAREQVTLREILEYLFRLPPPVLAQRYIKNVTVKGIYFLVSFRRIKGKMYWEKRLGLPSLFGFTIEQFYPHHWHFYQIPETKIVPDDIVVDCGAAEGLFSLVAANICKKVYAIEPLPSFIKSMKLQFANMRNVTIVPRALGEKEKYVYITESLLASTISEKSPTSAEEIKVHMTTVDNLFYEKGKKFTYLKADLEGYEMEMLKGAKKSIREYKPKIAITVYHHVYDCDEIKSYLHKLVPSYKFIIKGISEDKGQPIMLHAYIVKANK